MESLTWLLPSCAELSKFPKGPRLGLEGEVLLWDLFFLTPLFPPCGFPALRIEAFWSLSFSNFFLWPLPFSLLPSIQALLARGTTEDLSCRMSLRDSARRASPRLLPSPPLARSIWGEKSSLEALLHFSRSLESRIKKSLMEELLRGDLANPPKACTPWTRRYLSG